MKNKWIQIVWLLAMSCTADSRSPLKSADWLLGTWEMQTEQGPAYEQWTLLNETTYKGRAFALQGKDTLVFEEISLLQQGDTLYYLPRVQGQNQGQEVRFSASTINESKLVFENPLHDFPQTITYTRLGTDSLRAEISGLYKGEMRRESFDMRRLPW